MYDIEQAKKEIAQKKIDDMMKGLRYREHMDIVERVSITGLPFKVIKALFDEFHKQEHKEVLPNKFYPRNHNNIADFREWLEQAHPELIPIFGTQQELLERLKGLPDSNNERFKQQMAFMYGSSTKLNEEGWTPQYRALQEEYEQSQVSFSNDTQEGIAKRKYYMARFLQGYDFTTFSMFDFYGMMNHTQQEVEQFRRECMELQADFEKNPQNYFTEYVPLPKARIEPPEE